VAPTLSTRSRLCHHLSALGYRCTIVTNFHIQDELLCHLGHLCVLASEQEKMIWEAHYSHMAGHFGMEKTVAILQKKFYWPKIRKDVKQVYQILHCMCHFQAIHQEARLIHPSSYPREASISMDYMSGLPSTKHDNDYVFVVVDRFSKMAILTSYKKNITATDTAKLFLKRVWVHFGIPQTIIFDQDNGFLNTFWSSLWSLLDTKLTKSIAFHPKTNDQTKVVNRMIVHIMRMYNSKHLCLWDESLPYVQHSYNMALHSSTDHIPF
jgi:hypothetical protein